MGVRVNSLETYGIIDLKGGDMIYVVKAISMGCSILTQDKKMKTIANKLVLNTAMNYEDFLNANA